MLFFTGEISYTNLVRGEFPDNVILNECNPKASKFNKQLIKLIVSGMLFLWMIMATMSLVIDTGGIALDDGNGFIFEVR